MIDNEIAANKTCWDLVSRKYFGVCSLPSWGPFRECEDRDLLGNFAGKTLLEIGCGSGHSISYLAQRGAKKLYGLDLSTTQIALATEVNRSHIDRGQVELFEASMERRLDFSDLDIVYSIYAIGWTRDPKAVFENVCSYLKPGGKLVWSWGHPLFGIVKHEAGRVVFLKSYFDQGTWFEEGWSGSDGAYMQNRTIANWFRFLTAAGFIVRHFLEPEPVLSREADVDPSRYYSPAKAKVVPGTMIFVCEKG